MTDDDNVIDAARLLRISEQVDAHGRDAVDPDDLAYYDRCWKTIKRVVIDPFREEFKKRGASMVLGTNLYEALPAELQERWGNLRPAEFALLASVFPEELPADARRLLES